MNTPNNSHENPSRSLGFWLKVSDRLLAHEFETAFAAAGITRRDWRMLDALASASADADADADGDARAQKMAERIARKPHALHTLTELGWVTREHDAWIVTAEGLAARERLADTVSEIRTRIAGAVSPEDLATTIASLEAIARELGWDESQPGPRGPGRGRFGRGGPQKFGGASNHDPARRGGPRPEFGPNLHHGFGPGDAPADSHRGGLDGAHRGGPAGHRGAERAYERGFDAGFARGQAANVASADPSAA